MYKVKLALFYRNFKKKNTFVWLLNSFEYLFKDREKAHILYFSLMFSMSKKDTLC